MPEPQVATTGRLGSMPAASIRRAERVRREHGAVGGDQLVERQIAAARDVAAPEAGPRLGLRPGEASGRAHVHDLLAAGRERCGPRRGPGPRRPVDARR